MSESSVTHGSTGWRSAARDVVLIVVSILIAFVLDASWDASQERARRASVMEAIETEFSRNLEMLRADSTKLAEARAATSALLSEFSPAGTDLSADSIRMLIVTSFDVQSGFEPIVGVSATLGPQEASQFLGDSLSLLIARWQPRPRRFASQGELLEAGVVRVVGVWSELGLPVSDFTPPYVGVPPSGFGGDVRTMLRHVEVESLFASRAVELAELSIDYGEAAELVRQIISTAGAS